VGDLDEAYEDVVFDGEHVSIAIAAGMYERTIPLYTFSKSYAMTGLRSATWRSTIRRSAIARKGAVLHRQQHRLGRAVRRIGALEGRRTASRISAPKLRARRDLFYRGIADLGGDSSRKAAAGAFYAFLRHRLARRPSRAGSGSISWRTASI
jgi:aspartate aminotransferase